MVIYAYTLSEMIFSGCEVGADFVYFQYFLLYYVKYAKDYEFYIFSESEIVADFVSFRYL